MKKSEKRASCPRLQRHVESALGHLPFALPIGADTFEFLSANRSKKPNAAYRCEARDAVEIGRRRRGKVSCTKVCRRHDFKCAPNHHAHHRTPSRRNKFAPNLKWYRGRIASAPDADGACDVEYDDGDFEEHGTCRPMHPCPACKPLITSLRLSQYRQNTFVCRVRWLPSSRHCRRLFRRPIQ